VNLLLHQQRKDLRQHRSLLLAWLGVLLLRALLELHAASSTPAALLSAVDLAGTCLDVVHVALLVVLAAVLVQADPATGATAFWLTRPIPGWQMLLSKGLTAVALLVLLPSAVAATVVALRSLSSTSYSRTS
jgi:hypothetical protein